MRMRCQKKAYFCGIKPLSFKVPFPFIHPRKKCSCGFNKARIKASAQKCCPMLEQCPVQHRFVFPVAVHGMWGPQGHMTMEKTWPNARESQESFHRSVLEFQTHPKTHTYASLAIFAAKDVGKCSFINGHVIISNKVNVFL